jgi:hypothetical protein
VSNKTTITIESLTKTTIIGIDAEKKSVTVSGPAVEKVATKFTLGQQVDVTFGADGKVTDVVKTPAAKAATTAKQGREGRSPGPIGGPARMPR